MSSTASAPRASEALAHFVAAPHAGAAFDDALEMARVRLTAARTALDTPTVASELVARALAAYGAPLRRAFTAGARLAENPVARADAPIVAAALASGESTGCSEAGVLAAIAVGREVAARLARGLTFDPPWNAVAVIAGIAAGAAAARAASLDPDAARHAIGLAATQAAGLGAVEDTALAAVGSGKSAADALEAALLAGLGFTAASAWLEGRRGLAALMASQFDEAAVCEALGQRWFSAERAVRPA